MGLAAEEEGGTRTSSVTPAGLVGFWACLSSTEPHLHARHTSPRPDVTHASASVPHASIDYATLCRSYVAGSRRLRYRSCRRGHPRRVADCSEALLSAKRVGERVLCEWEYVPAATVVMSTKRADLIANDRWAVGGREGWIRTSVEVCAAAAARPSSYNQVSRRRSRGVRKFRVEVEVGKLGVDAVVEMTATIARPNSKQDIECEGVHAAKPEDPSPST